LLAAKQTDIVIWSTWSNCTKKMAQLVSPDEHNPFLVEPGSELPVGVQLSWRMRALIVTGRLASGESLPSVRQLANWAGVNVNTVRAVYESLEEEGLIFSRQGQGTFVADHAAAEPHLETIALDALQRSQEAGVDPRQLAIVLMACANMLGSEETAEGPTRAHPVDLVESSETIEVRQELRRQIARLEAELAAYVRDLPAEGLPTAPIRAEAHVAGVEELEQTRDTLIAQLSSAQKAAEARARREGEVRAGRTRMLEAQDVSRDASPAAGPLGGAMSWWRAKH
jgi:DNA-binding transcriptional regulator YhcF (GntR family)